MKPRGKERLSGMLSLPSTTRLIHDLRKQYHHNTRLRPPGRRTRITWPPVVLEGRVTTSVLSEEENLSGCLPNARLDREISCVAMIQWRYLGRSLSALDAVLSQWQVTLTGPKGSTYNIVVLGRRVAP